MKLSLTMLSFVDQINQGKMTTADFIRRCREYPLDAVDLLEYYWVDKEREIREVPGLLKESGLDISAFCIGNNFIQASREARQQEIEKVKDGIMTADRLGARRLRIFGGSAAIPEGVRKEERLDIIVDCIGQCIEAARQYDVTLVIENHGGIPKVSSEVKHVLEGVNSPWLQVNFDTGNFLGTGGEDPMEAARILYPYTGHIHIKDLIRTGNGYEACPVGEGVIPVEECLRFFQSKGYNGAVCYEFEAWDRMGSDQGVKEGLAYLKAILQKLG
jgi:sugar phosphate isomerase/epimerase